MQQRSRFNCTDLSFLSYAHSLSKLNRVHLHSSKAGLAGRLALRCRVPTLFQPHAWSFDAVDGLARRGALAWERWATRWAAAVVCVSAAERDSGIRLGVRARYEVVPNGVDLDKFAAADELNRGVATLDDANAKEDPQTAALAAWSLVHGFSLLWVNGAVSGQADPLDAVERLARMLFDG